ncbi:MAG: glycosyltransferase family 39 protein [Actinomycetota bacterium]
MQRARRLLREQPELAVLAAIVLLGGGLRFATLGLQSYRYDEAVTAVRVLHPSLFDTLSTVPNSESSPPLYYAVAWLWSRLFGVGEVGLRSLSALAGTASIIVIYLAASTLTTRRVGLIAAAIVAVNPVLIWFSQDARAYSLVFLLTCLSFLFFARALRAAEQGPSRGVLAGWALFSALALATHYFAIFVVAPEAALMLWRTVRRRQVVIACACVAAVAALLLPIALQQASHQRAQWIAREPLGQRLERSAAKLVGDDNGDEHGTRLAGPFPLALPAGLAIAAGCLIGLLAGNDERRRLVPALWVAAAGVGVPLLLALAGSDYLVGRNILPVFVPLIVIIAAGFGVRRAGLAGLALAAAFCLLGLAFTIQIDRLQKYQRENLANAAAAIGPAHGQRAVVTVDNFGDLPLMYYLDAHRASGSLAPLSEIDLVGSKSNADRYARSLLPRQFQRVESKPVSWNFTLTRFRARRPVAVPLRILHQGRLVGGGRVASVLVPGE